MYIKRFLEWIGLKKQLHSIRFNPPYVNEGDIWWASMGENIGSEINGKNRLFSRPVIILRKLSHGFYFVIPTTTKLRNGSWYVEICQRGIKMNACLHQSRSIDHRRLSNKLGRLDDVDLAKVKKNFLNLFI